MSDKVRHETSDVNVTAIFKVGAGLAGVTLVASVLVWLLVLFLSREVEAPPREYPLAVTHEQRLPPEPRLQTNPREDLQELRDQEEKALDSYGWVDKEAGVVRVPIGEAMRLTVERGLPARAQEAPKR